MSTHLLIAADFESAACVLVCRETVLATVKAQEAILLANPTLAACEVRIHAEWRDSVPYEGLDKEQTGLFEGHGIALVTRPSDLPGRTLLTGARVVMWETGHFWLAASQNGERYESTLLVPERHPLLR